MGVYFYSWNIYYLTILFTVISETKSPMHYTRRNSPLWGLIITRQRLYDTFLYITLAWGYPKHISNRVYSILSSGFNIQKMTLQWDVFYAVNKIYSRWRLGCEYPYSNFLTTNMRFLWQTPERNAYGSYYGLKTPS